MQALPALREAGDVLRVIKTYYNLAELSLREGKYEEALSLAEKALGLNGDDAEANFVKGICYAKYMNRMQEGIPYLERAVSLAPTNGYWMEDLAVAYGMSGQIRKT